MSRKKYSILTYIYFCLKDWCWGGLWFWGREFNYAILCWIILPRLNRFRPGEIDRKFHPSTICWSYPGTIFRSYGAGGTSWAGWVNMAPRWNRLRPVEYPVWGPHSGIPLGKHFTPVRSAGPTPVPSSGATPVPSAGATGQAGKAGHSWASEINRALIATILGIFDNSFTLLNRIFEKLPSDIR